MKPFRLSGSVRFAAAALLLLAAGCLNTPESGGVRVITVESVFTSIYEDGSPHQPRVASAGPPCPDAVEVRRGDRQLRVGDERVEDATPRPHDVERLNQASAAILLQQRVWHQTTPGTFSLSTMGTETKPFFLQLGIPPGGQEPEHAVVLVTPDTVSFEGDVVPEGGTVSKGFMFQAYDDEGRRIIVNETIAVEFLGAWKEPLLHDACPPGSIDGKD